MRLFIVLSSAGAAGGAFAAVTVAVMASGVASSLGLRAVKAVVVGAGIVVGAVWLRTGRPPQRWRETPFEWKYDAPEIWAVKMGATLGVGATTRIGALIWYVLPAAAMTGGVAVAAVVGSVYGLSRNVLPAALISRPNRRAVIDGGHTAVGSRSRLVGLIHSAKRLDAPAACAGLLLLVVV